MINNATNSDGTSATVTPFNILASVGASFIWCATARDRLSSSGDPNASSVREHDAIYARGLKENLFLTSNTQDCWRWRRICFTSKAEQFRGTGTIGTDPVALETSNGWTRLLRNNAGTPFNNTVATLLFKGSVGIDWFTGFTAKVDTTRVTLMYDKTRILRSGNAAGVAIRSKHWYPMNKNLTYSNDETGEGESVSNFSTQNNIGMGDYYVVDFFECVTSVSASAQLNFQTEATLYWHER